MDAAGLIGISGLSIRKRENSQSGAATSTLFNGCSRGVVLFSIAQSNMDGHFDAIIYVGSSNSIRVVSYNNGPGAEYQKFSMSNGSLTITNTGYGVGSYIAYLFEWYTPSDLTNLLTTLKLKA